jgi:protein O-GlcNAc transferase
MALSINPEHVEALTNLGNLLSLEGRYKEAEVRHRMAISLQPNHSEVCANLGRNLASQGRYEEAESYLERAISLQPNLASAYNNLGGVLGNMGKIPEAVENFEKAVQLDPEHYDAHSNILFGRNYLRDFSTDLYLDEARRYGSKVSERALPKFSSWNSRGEGKRIRVGFVSGDFKKHSVAYFLEGLIKHFDKERFELTAFPTSHKSDEVTHRIKPLFNEWVPIVGESDFDAARIIHERGINALIDLSGHTAFNRLPVLSFRPAPIQATWLGFFASTGLPEIDYFIGDPQMAPPGEEKHFTEQVWNLPETWLCFSPPQEVVEIQAPPAQKNGFITFGNFGNLSKVNDDVIAVWSRVMTEIPSSKLFLKAKQLGDKKISEKLVLKFRENGIDSNRLTLEGSSPREEYLRAYNDIDIVLDTFPYPGGTTSNEALWMSVPILTLRGDRFLSRLGFSINTNAGLTDWVANDVNEYVQKAVVLTSDLSRLANFRSRLRAKVLKTPLFDQARFARNFENMIKDMCDKHNI